MAQLGEHCVLRVSCAIHKGPGLIPGEAIHVGFFGVFFFFVNHFSRCLFSEMDKPSTNLQIELVAARSF